MNLKNIAAEGNSAAISNGAGATSRFARHYSTPFASSFLYAAIWGLPC